MLLGKPIPGADRRRRQKRQVLWKTGRTWDCNAFVLAPALLLAAGAIEMPGKPGLHPGLTALDPTDGKQIWARALPANPVLWGAAIDHAARIAVALDDGRVLCFGKKD